MNKNNLSLDKILWYSYALAVQALCVSNLTIGKTTIKTILSNQKPDGSFGKPGSVGKLLNKFLVTQNFK